MIIGFHFLPTPLQTITLVEGPRIWLQHLLVLNIMLAKFWKCHFNTILIYVISHESFDGTMTNKFHIYVCRNSHVTLKHLTLCYYVLLHYWTINFNHLAMVLIHELLMNSYLGVSLSNKCAQNKNQLNLQIL